MRSLSAVPLVKLNDIPKRLMTVNYGTESLQESAYANQANLVSDRIDSTIVISVLNELKNGGFILLHTGNTIKVPSVIPSFATMQNNNQIKSVIDMTTHAKLTKNGELKMPIQAFYTLLHTGYIHKKLIENFTPIATNKNEILFTSALGFSKMLNKVLDKLYGINVDRTKSDLSLFLISKYFVHFLAEVDDEEVADSIAFRTTSGDTSINVLHSLIPEASPLEVKSGYQEGAMAFIQSMLDILMSTQGVAPKNINARQVIMEWVLMYGKSSLIGLEYLPYYYHILHSTTFGAHLAKDYMVESTLNNLTVNITTKLANIYR